MTLAESAIIFEHPSNHDRLSKSQQRAVRKALKAKKAGRVSDALVARTPNQEIYLNALRAGESVFAAGPAGSGKSFIPCRFAARQLALSQITKIVLARATAAPGRHALGFLPGRMEQKMKPWLLPLFDALKQEVGAPVIDQWQQEGKLEIASFEHMRGRTFSDCFLILDEAQNCTFSDLKLLLTRIGENCQVVLTGDLDQTDIKDTGFVEIIRLARAHAAPVRIVNFDSSDVVRSAFTKAWVRIFEWEDSPFAVKNLDELPDFLHNAHNVMKSG